MPLIRKPSYHKEFSIVTEPKLIVPATGTDKRLSKRYSIYRKRRFCFLHKESHTWTHVWFRRLCASEAGWSFSESDHSRLRRSAACENRQCSAGVNGKEKRYRMKFQPIMDKEERPYISGRDLFASFHLDIKTLASCSALFQIIDTHEKVSQIIPVEVPKKHDFGH